MQQIEIKQISYGGALYEEAVRLRQALLRTPLGLSFTSEQLAAEAADIHFIALTNEKVVGTVYLHPREEGILQLRQMVVDPTFERRGIGRQLLRAALSYAARQEDINEIMMQARVTAVAFYEKEGFQTVGDVFEELTLPHITMRRHRVRGAF